MKNKLNTAQSFGRALIAALAFGFTCSAGFAAESHYYVNDPLATTVAIADSAGEIAAMEADAFGAPLAIGEAPGRFTGKPYDADLGAFVFPFRNYRPEEGRWMSADPSGFPDGFNSRSYVSNVFNLIDPWGLATVTVYAYGPNSVSNTGHAWTNVTTDDGVSTTRGLYPTGLIDDSRKIPEVKHTFDVSDEDAKNARDAQLNPGDDTLGGNNCADLVAKVLDAAKIEHDDFGLISRPSKVVTWIKKINKE